MMRIVLSIVLIPAFALAVLTACCCTPKSVDLTHHQSAIESQTHCCCPGGDQCSTTVISIDKEKAVFISEVAPTLSNPLSDVLTKNNQTVILSSQSWRPDPAVTSVSPGIIQASALQLLI